MNIFARARPSIARASARVGPGLATPLLTTDHGLGLDVDFMEGGKPENPEKNPSKHRIDQLQQLAWITKHEAIHPGAHGHPSSYKPTRLGLTWNSVVKGNALTASAIHAPCLT